MSNFLNVQGLSKAYWSGGERLNILVDLKLQVEAGQMLAVTGASGSGKSTFLHLVGGMEKPDAGQILVQETDITQLSPGELARFRNEKVGFVFQFHHLLPEFSTLENVMFPLLLRRTSAVEAADKARFYLGEMGLVKRIYHRPGELSGGERQRVAIARALAGQPSLLLADEPTGNLDADTADLVFGSLVDAHRRFGLTAIIVTHNRDLARRCDYEKSMQGGKLP